MKRFKITVHHDHGKTDFIVYATDEASATAKICAAENCPQAAIIKIELLPYFVSMIDNYMSGWGHAKDKKNKFIVICQTFEEAETVARNAAKRPEMKYINISKTPPKIARNQLASYETFEELGQIWKK